MHDVIVKCSTDSSLLISILVILLTSPLVLAVYNYFFALLEKRFKFPDWVAVFISSGQVYFGKIKRLTRRDLTLENIYYLQSSADYDQKNQRPNEGVSLVKLGKELHGPQDFMLINRAHIVFLENITADGEVLKAIRANENKK